jgi:phage terminase large subunit GpA-like protein
MTQAQYPRRRSVSSQCISNLAKRGVPVREWRRKKGVRGEPLDCRVYSFAALQALASMGLSLERECERIETLTATTGERAAQRVSYSRWMNT